MLASSWSVCPEQSKKESKGCPVTKELFISKDFGKNFEKLINYVV